MVILSPVSLVDDGDRRLGNRATRLVGHNPSDDTPVLTLPEQQTCQGEKGNSCQDDPPDRGTRIHFRPPWRYPA